MLLIHFEDHYFRIDPPKADLKYSIFNRQYSITL